MTVLIVQFDLMSLGSSLYFIRNNLILFSYLIASFVTMIIAFAKMGILAGAVMGTNLPTQQDDSFNSGFDHPNLNRAQGS